MDAPPTSMRFAAVPVFPLPQLVLFPGTQLPLHVFEHRYRHMTHDCLLANEPLMVVAQLQPGFDTDNTGRPAIHHVGGLGRIVHHQRNADGSYDLLLEALTRVSLSELPSGNFPYRRADITCLADRIPHSGFDPDELGALLSLAGRITMMLQEAQPAFELDLDPEDEPGVMADHIADQLVLAADSRQAVLECLDVGSRIRMVVEQLLRLHAALDAHHDQDQTVH